MTIHKSCFHVIFPWVVSLQRDNGLTLWLNLTNKCIQMILYQFQGWIFLKLGRFPFCALGTPRAACWVWPSCWGGCTGRYTQRPSSEASQRFPVLQLIHAFQPSTAWCQSHQQAGPQTSSTKTPAESVHKRCPAAQLPPLNRQKDSKMDVCLWNK